jgi:hypothetical protein
MTTHNHNTPAIAKADKAVDRDRRSEDGKARDGTGRRWLQKKQSRIVDLQSSNERSRCSLRTYGVDC